MPQESSAAIVEESNMTNAPNESLAMQGAGSVIGSPNGSMTYPYRSEMEDNSFPRYHLMAKPGIDPETFNRTLSMLGHGFPLWNPLGVLNRPKEQLNSGISIGDVGFLTRRGDFQCYFNLFLPPDSPLQRHCPPDLVPLEPPLKSEISVDPTHFPPGTALVSDGIESSILSSSPFDIQFTVNTREGGILVFPDGATREDLISTTRIRDYVKEHALNWYVYFREALGAVVYPNGSLYVVTGTDKAKEWACCITSNRHTKMRKLRKSTTITYRGAKEDSPHHWQSDYEAEYELTHKRSRPTEHVGQCALFIRGMRVAVNVLDWTQHLLQNRPPRDCHFCVLRTTPAFGLRAKIQTLNECRSSYSQKCPDQEGDYLRIAFHPLDVISKLLLTENLSPAVAIVDDSIWSVVADKSDASLESIIRLLIQILDTHEPFIKDGLITLIPRANSQEHLPIWPLIPTFIQHKYHRMRRLRQISNRLAKVFPGSGVPTSYLLSWIQD